MDGTVTMAVPDAYLRTPCRASCREERCSSSALRQLVGRMLGKARISLRSWELSVAEKLLAI